jgi:DNA-binding NarL/FixJ family response regulator
MKSRILIVDDHPVFSMALATLLNQEEDFEVCGVVADIPSAKRAITTMSPDLLTIGITLAGDNGLHLVRELSASTCSLPILVLSLHDERIWAKRAIHAGASGYLMKSDASDNVVLALRNIQSGRIHASAKTLVWHPDLIQMRPAVASAHFSQKGAD